MASIAVSKCVKAPFQSGILPSEAAKQVPQTWRGFGEKAQWGRRFVSESAQSFRPASKGMITNFKRTGNAGEERREKGSRHQQATEKERVIAVEVSTESVKKSRKGDDSALDVPRQALGRVLDSEIVAKILAVFSTVQSLAALELKVKFRKYSLSLYKVAGRVKVIRCRLILDAKNLKMRLQIKKSSTAALLIPPTPLYQAVSMMNVLINRLPLTTEERVFQLFTAISGAVFTAQEISRPAAAAFVSPDVIGDVSSEFLNALKSLDLQIWCSSALKLKLKKRKLFTRVGRKMVTIDAKEGMQILKEPRVLFRRHEFQDALGFMRAWVRSVSEFKVAPQVVNIATAIKDL